MKNKKLIGVYGPSGSGKSTFCRLLADELGFHYIDLDLLGHEVLAEASSEIAEAFPSAVEDGKISRASLAKIVFNDEKELERLNQISHPRIDKKLRGIIGDLSGVILIDGAIIHKSEIIKDLDLLVLLSCDRIIRVERLVEKRHISYEKAEKQADLFDGKDYDILVDTSLGLDSIKEEILDVFKRYQMDDYRRDDE